MECLLPTTNMVQKVIIFHKHLILCLCKKPYIGFKEFQALYQRLNCFILNGNIRCKDLRFVQYLLTYKCLLLNLTRKSISSS